MSLSYQAAREIHRDILRTTTPTCNDISSVANTAARRVLDRYRVENETYDEQTRSGRNQGVRWPPLGGGA